MERALERDLEILRSGGVLAWPTDTTWGLLARADRPEAVERVYRIKRRPRSKPLQLLVADLDTARRLVEPGPWSRTFERLARTYWPGPLTLVVPASATAPRCCVHAGKVGLRIPDDAELRDLLAALGGCAAATSLNPSGSAPVLHPEEVLRYADRVDRIHPGTPGGRRASTVVDLESRRVLREDALPAEAIRQLLEES